MVDDDLSKYILRQKYGSTKAQWAATTLSDQMIAYKKRIDREYAFKFLAWKRIYLLSSKQERKRQEREILNKTIEEATQRDKWERK